MLEAGEERAAPAVRALLVVLGLVLAAAMSFLEARLASHKVFWMDEAFEIERTCPTSPVSLLVRGARTEVSPAPLYFVLERLVVRRVVAFDRSILVRYRLVSLVSAAAAMGTLVLVVTLRLPGPSGLVALMALTWVPLFHRHAAENRPHMVWLLAFLLGCLACAEAAAHPPRGARPWIMAAAGVMLTLSAVPGGVQAVVAMMVCAWAWRRWWPEEQPGRREPRWWWPVAGLALVLAVHYGRGTVWRYRPNHLELTRVQGPELLGAVLQLLWGSDLLSGIGNALAGCGAVAPIALVAAARKRRSARFASTLAIIALGQIGLGALLGTEIARRGYYFQPRLFLYLVVCRALLVAVGTWWLADVARRRLGPAWIAAPAILAALGLLGCLASMDRIASDVADQTSVEERDMPPRQCLPWTGDLSVYVPADGNFQSFGPNVIVALSNELTRCGWSPGPPKPVLARRDAANGPLTFEVERDPPPGAVPLRQCGRAVVLRGRD